MKNHDESIFKYNPRGPRKETILKVCTFLIAVSEMRDTNNIYLREHSLKDIQDLCSSHRIGKNIVSTMRRLNYISKPVKGKCEMLLARGSISVKVAERILKESNKYQSERYVKAKEVSSKDVVSNVKVDLQNLLALPKSIIENASIFVKYSDAKEFVMTKGEDYIIVNVISATETSKKLVEFT